MKSLFAYELWPLLKVDSLSVSKNLSTNEKPPFFQLPAFNLL